MGIISSSPRSTLAPGERAADSSVRGSRNEEEGRKEGIIHKQPVPLAPGYGSYCCEKNTNGFDIPLSVSGKHLLTAPSSLDLRLATGQNMWSI